MFLIHQKTQESHSFCNMTMLVALYEILTVVLFWWFSLFPSQVCWLQPWPLVFTVRPSLPSCTWCPSPCCLCSPWPTWRCVCLHQHQNPHRASFLGMSKQCQLNSIESPFPHFLRNGAEFDIRSLSGYLSRVCAVSVTLRYIIMC